MPTLNKAELIKRIDQQLEWLESRAKEQFKEAEQAYQDELALWLVEGGKRDRLVKLLRDAANAAARGVPVPVPRPLSEWGSSRSSLWFSKQKPEYKHVPDSTLVSLKELLESIQEEVVSTNFLNEAGYRNYNYLFRR